MTLTFLVTAVAPAMAENDVVEDIIQDTATLTAQSTSSSSSSNQSNSSSGGGSNKVEHSIEAYRAVGNKVVIKGTAPSTNPEVVKGHQKKLAWYITSSAATQPLNQMSTKMT